MQDERNTPQDDDEVEAHGRGHGGAPIEEPGRSALDEDDDEVEAHGRGHGGAPAEQDQ